MGIDSGGCIWHLTGKVEDGNVFNDVYPRSPNCHDLTTTRVDSRSEDDKDVFARQRDFKEIISC